MSTSKEYCNSLTNYIRLKTREVMVGNVGVGGNNPIRIQSMTTTDTMDTKATVEQSIRMIDAGCEIVRITAQGKKEAQNLANIKAELKARGYNTPLVADIHFTPNAALIAAAIVDKVRINPGNYVDSKKFKEIEYTDDSYASELLRIRERLIPLIDICKEHGTALRIGTNHGSLSDRIMSRYGDSAIGMVESALEFLRICREQNYHKIILSMKSSNTQVVVQAYRLLVNKMKEEGMNYPLHLGVTEAGEAEDGRIKSAVGIGTLLEDGLGDTIRVSLTEEPEFEIPVAKELVKRYDTRAGHYSIDKIDKNPLNSFDYSRRKTNQLLNIGGKNAPIVIANFSDREEITASSLFALGYQYSVPLDKWNITDTACDYIFVGDNSIDFDTPGTLGRIYNHKSWLNDKYKSFPCVDVVSYLSGCELSEKLNFISVSLSELSDELIVKLKTDLTAVLIVNTNHTHGMAEQRKLFIDLINNSCNTPVVIGRSYNNLTKNQIQLQSATDMGALLIDGLGDGVFITATNCGGNKSVNETAFGILQASRTRISKTEYISCPSCGRTLFDLQETTSKIRSVTSHLKGLKIGVMGCIVNGPGEMADADYGYVGTGKGKITLYKEKEVVQRNIPEDEAVNSLIGLIKQHGDWVDPKI